MAPKPAPYADASWHDYTARDSYSTGSMPRVREFDSGSKPSYPSSWGSAPEPAKVEFRTGPRARFS